MMELYLKLYALKERYQYALRKTVWNNEQYKAIHKRYKDTVIMLIKLENGLRQC
jgi:hypothetical protein